MTKLNAKVFTNNTEIKQRLKNLFESEEIAFEFHDSWNNVFDHGSSLFILIDQEMLPDFDDVTIPESTSLFVVIRERSFDEVRKWMQMGAEQVLLFPDELDELETSIRNKMKSLRSLRSKMTESSTGPSGKVSAFYSTKGGSGKTLIATITAQSLQMQHDQRVVYIDLNGQFGGVDVITALEPVRSYVDLKPVIEELSLNHIQNVSQTDPDTGVQILQGPADPEKAEEVSDLLISRVIQTCKFHFDHVILDLPSTLNTYSVTGLNEATHIFYVMQPDSLSLRGYKQATRIFQQFHLASKDNLSILLNRKHRKAELTEKSIHKLIDKKIAGSIKADFFSIQPFLNMGKPFFNKKGKPLCQIASNVSQIVEKTFT